MERQNRGDSVGTGAEVREDFLEEGPWIPNSLYYLEYKCRGIIEVQGGRMICLRSHSKLMSKVRLPGPPWLL